MVSDICKYIRDNIENGLNLEDLSSHFGYSKFHLSRKFKQETGYTYKQFIEALKIEQSIEAILDGDRNITGVFNDSKHESSGTFSNTFKKLTGLSPKLYKKSVTILYHTVINSVKSKGEIIYRRARLHKGGRLSVTLHYPDIHDERVSFIGLFENGIPNSAPVVGIALYKRTHCVLDFIPEGTYHLLVTEIDLQSDISSFFLLNSNYRAKLDHQLAINDDLTLNIDLCMRLPVPEDPPIIINLPNLVKQTLMKNRK